MHEVISMIAPKLPYCQKHHLGHTNLHFRNEKVSFSSGHPSTRYVRQEKSSPPTVLLDRITNLLLSLEWLTGVVFMRSTAV